MKQKGCALARVEDVALQPCSARKVFKPLMIEGMGELMWACPLCYDTLGKAKRENGNGRERKRKGAQQLRTNL